MTYLAYVLQKGLLVPAELSHFRPIQQLTGLYSLILEGRQAPCKHSFPFKYGRKEEIIRKFSITVKVRDTCPQAHSENATEWWAMSIVKQSCGKRSVQMNYFNSITERPNCQSAQPLGKYRLIQLSNDKGKKKKPQVIHMKNYPQEPSPALSFKNLLWNLFLSIKDRQHCTAV